MLMKACVLFLGMHDLEMDNCMCLHVICRAQGIVLHHGREGPVRVSDKLCSRDISDSMGMACAHENVQITLWWENPLCALQLASWMMLSVGLHGGSF